MRFGSLPLLLVILMLGLAGLPVRAQDASPADIEAVRQTTNKLIEQLVQSGILSKEKAQALLDEAKQSAQKTQVERKGKDSVVRVPYVPKVVREQIKQEIRDEVTATAREEKWGRPAAYPAWLERFRFYGDMRLRYQRNQMAAGNDTSGFYFNAQDVNSGADQIALNTTKGDDLWRYRFRLGLDVTLTDWSMIGIRLTTGGGTTPVSDNQTLGTSFNRSTFALDRAFLKLEPTSWMSIYGGRIPNMFMNTDLVWDADLTFEGAAVKFAPTTWTKFRPFLTAGAFPLEKIDCTTVSQQTRCGKDKWLYGLQVGADQGMGKARLKAGLAYYEYTNFAGERNTLSDPSNRSSIPKFLQRGNTLFNVVPDASLQKPLYGLASDFRLINLTAQLDLSHFEPYGVSFLMDYVKNIGYDKDKIFRRTAGAVNQEARNVGYQARLTVGHDEVNERGKWQAFGGYKYLQRDAVYDGFTDSDFHLGGTNAKGWILGGSYGLADKTYLRARWFSANEIDGPPLSIDVFMLDLNAEF